MKFLYPTTIDKDISRSFSIELAHIQLVSVRSLDYGTAIEDVLELDFVQSAQVTLKSYLKTLLHKNEERRPGMRSGSAKTCLSCLIIIAIALPYKAEISFIFSSS